MNKNFSNIDENIFIVSIMEKIRHASFSSNIILGIFSCARLILEGKSSMICFSIDKNGVLLGEQVVSSGFKTTVSSNLNLIQNFINKTNAYSIVLACNYIISNDEDFINRAHDCDELYIFLLNQGVKLRNYILTDNFEFEFLIE